VSDDDAAAFAEFRDGLVGLPLSHLWRGYGSAIFLEFGRLTPGIRASGEAADPSGELGLMIEWSWRIENRTSILCGSWSDEPLWKPTFDLLAGQTAVEVSLFGRLPEVSLALSGGLYVSSFMTADGDPSWCLFDRRNGGSKSVGVREGRLLAKR
jgi:hypothetical protein